MEYLQGCGITLTSAVYYPILSCLLPTLSRLLPTPPSITHRSFFMLLILIG